MLPKPDHGGNLDDAIARFGGAKSDWIDLSTGINPDSYPIGSISQHAWTALPDSKAQDDLLQAARRFWNVPEEAAIIATPGVSSAIALLPQLWPRATVNIQTPTYNEHATAFNAHKWILTRASAQVQVAVHPNNPDGRLWSTSDFKAPSMIIDESFCDTSPDKSHIAQVANGKTIVLKGLGKFWGLAGLRLGFAIGAPELITKLQSLLGPWAISGPAQEIGARALGDHEWANAMRAKLEFSKTRLDQEMQIKGAKLIGGTPLFRLYDVQDASAAQTALAQHHIWTRIFPYSRTWIRLGLPADHQWDRIETAKW